MTPEKIVENHKKYVLQSWSKQGNLNPIPVAKAEGIYFYDFDGNKYTDMSSQLVNLNLGYGNKAIGDAIKEQVDKFCFVGPSYATEAKSTLAEMIINLLPDSFGKVFFTNAGADANENAIITFVIVHPAAVRIEPRVNVTNPPRVIKAPATMADIK